MWNRITVGKFQELYDILQGKNFDSDIARDIALLSALEGKPADYYEDMLVTDFRKEKEKLSWLSLSDIPAVPIPSRLKVNGREYQIVYEFDQLNAGQFIDVVSVSKTPEENILNMHKLLAAICLPIRRKKFWGITRGEALGKYGDIPFHQVAEDMLSVPILQAQAAALFFYRVWEEYLRVIPGCLERKVQQGRTLTEMEGAMYLAALSTRDGAG
ncbi:hypothetical protein [Chitinophaga sp. sic0106]|uniref:hypothetical protein n=1 Tax=Chitinophaga sp. sic0106 TaxID=2854785 RepID=UPI001C46B25C|nr:hypothetical protein [Chitinophaga sp. sic0106]MBV7534060.1 hypothetical protein [Chitinophaga sp. sic0106]